MSELRNESTNKFSDISSEKQRTYHFPTGKITLVEPYRLSVSASGGHRVLTMDGICHYIPSGWLHLEWIVKEGKPHFVL